MSGLRISSPTSLSRRLASSRSLRRRKQPQVKHLFIGIVAFAVISFMVHVIKVEKIIWNQQQQQLLQKSSFLGPPRNQQQQQHDKQNYWEDPSNSGKKKKKTIFC